MIAPSIVCAEDRGKLYEAATPNKSGTPVKTRSSTHLQFPLPLGKLCWLDLQLEPKLYNTLSLVGMSYR